MSSRGLLVPTFRKSWVCKVEWALAEVLRSGMGDGILNGAEGTGPIERSSDVLIRKVSSWWSLCASGGWSARRVVVFVVVVGDDMVSHRVR